MRKKEKEITDRGEIEGILKKEITCCLAMVDDGAPYVLPTTYGYADNKLYFHSAQEGRKIEALKRNPKVSFTVYTDQGLIRGEEGNMCKSGAKFRSVIGFGTARFVEGEEKRKGMDVIMRQAFGPLSFNYSSEGFEGMTIIAVDIKEMTGKRSGY